MPKTRKPPTPPETYEVQINPNTLVIALESPNTLVIALESALQSATAPLYEEIGQLKQEVSQLRTEQADSHRSMSQMLGVWSQELRNAAESQNSTGKPSELEQQLKGIIDGARQLEQTAAAVARLDGQLEQKAERLNGVTESMVGQKQPGQVGGVAEVILSKISPGDLARYQAQIAKAKTTEPPIEKKQEAEQEGKRRRRRQIYQQYAAKYADRSPRECDYLVVRQLMSELLAERSGQRLSDDERGKVGRVLLQGPVAQELKQTQGEEAGVKYAMEVLAKAKQVVEKAQRRDQNRGMEL